MKKLLFLLIVATIFIGTNLSAKNMYDRIQAMEAQMSSLQKEIVSLQESNIKLQGQNTNKTHDSDDDEEDDQEEASEQPDNVESIDSYLATKDEDEDEDEDEVDSDDDSESADDEDEADDEEEFGDEISLEELDESISELNRATGGNHLKFTVDYRFAVDNLNYKMADGSEAKNDAFMTNRFWLNMGYKATNNLTFKGQIAYNKAFGARSGASNPTNGSFERFDWVTNENAYDDKLRIRSAYFLWQDRTFLGLQMPWTLSIGRRPSTGGHLINYRDDDNPTSPLAHAINVEFDGLSSKFVVAPSWGTYIKLCAGRGMTNASPKFTSTPYASNSAGNDIDLGGLIFVPFDNRQYKISTQYYYANNLIDAKNLSDQTAGFDTVGGLHSFTANLTIHGIGNEWSDFTDNTTFFLSGAWTKTNPKDNQGMLGSAPGESKSGNSIWVGTQFPSLLSEDGKWGLEFNHGSQYFRSITYAEDTNIGSKIATRGNAYEAYLTEYLVEDILSIQLRYTYIDYEYTGSNGFFGNTSGNSMSIEDIQAGAAAGDPTMIGMSSQIVDKAQDIRFYIRYKY